MAINGVGLDRRHGVAARASTKPAVSTARTAAAPQPSASKPTSPESAAAQPTASILSFCCKHVLVGDPCGRVNCGHRVV